MSNELNLSPEMQKRLDAWRKNVLPVKSRNVFGSSPGNFVSRRGDYGDDISDFENKQKAELYKDLDYRN